MVFPSSLCLSWSREREHNSHWELRHTSHSASSEMNSSFQTQCMEDRRIVMSCSSAFLFPFTLLTDRSALKPTCLGPLHSIEIHLIVHQKHVHALRDTLSFINVAMNQLESFLLSSRSNNKNGQSFTMLLNAVTWRQPSWTPRITYFLFIDCQHSAQDTFGLGGHIYCIYESPTSCHWQNCKMEV